MSYGEVGVKTNLPIFIIIINFYDICHKWENFIEEEKEKFQ